MDVARVIGIVQSRLRRSDALRALAAGAVACAALALLGAVVWRSPVVGMAIGVVTAAAVTANGMARARQRWTPLAAASFTEARVPGLDNLVVTAASLDAGVLGGARGMRDEIARQAEARAGLISPGAVVPLGESVWLAIATTLSATLILWGIASAPASLSVPEPPSEVVSGIRDVRLTITRPAYLGAGVTTSDAADGAEVPVGSVVRLAVDTGYRSVWLDQPGRGRRVLDEAGVGGFEITWTPEATESLALGVGDAIGEARESRLLVLRLLPDQAPTVKIAVPGRDLAFATDNQIVDVEIEAADAEGLASLELRYVRLSGSGEAFTFAEGRVPLQIDRARRTSWPARARWSLASLALDDGDALVYRAVVRDSRPDGEAVASESFTIDIGKRLEFAGAGFAVPDEDRRYAISQQMVIVKTERLHAERATLSADEWTTQTRFLAMEQRMVRSEVVFLSGGEVEDEVAEAEHSHELQEGRLENAGRAEMLRAINEMSRAEAKLNDGDTAGALPIERAALAALQRAFDRRRYFLRTLPERSRIDQSRRLSGDRRDARSTLRDVPEPAADALSEERVVMRALARARTDMPIPAVLAARVAALDQSSAELRKLAAALTAAPDVEARHRALIDAMAAIANRARAGLAPASSGELREPSALEGWWVDERRTERPRR